MFRALSLVLSVGAVLAALTIEASAARRFSQFGYGSGLGYYGYRYPNGRRAYGYPFRPGFEDPAYSSRTYCGSGDPTCYG